jgi:PKD repeat protein
MIAGGIVLLILTSNPLPEKVPMAYLKVSQSNDRVELLNQAGDTLTSKSIEILVDGVDRSSEFRKPENKPDWGTLKAGEQIYYTSPTKPKSVQILYVAKSGQYLLASSGPRTITPITIVPLVTPTPNIPVVAAPTVTQITPGSGYNNTFIDTLNLTGTAFLSGATMKLNGTGFEDIPAINVTVISPMQIRCSLNLSSAPEGLRNVVVTNIDGKEGMLVGGFNVIQAGIPPIANFTATPSNGTAPLTIQFNDTSTTLPISWTWTFGDGGTSNIQNASHRYTNPGTYTVKLTVTNATGSDSEIKTNYITVSPPVVTNISPTALFSANVVAGQTPLTVQFTDKSVSTGTTTYAWDINNDGTVDYTTKNPSHTYQAAGTYAVKLTVTNASGSASEIKTNYIKVSSAGVLSVLSVPSSTLYLTDYGIKADGSDETTLLQSAFNYAAANGKTKIVFPSGGKTIGLNDYVETPNNVELIGNGCTIKLIDEADINQENSFFYVNDGCYVHDLRFNGNSHNQKGSDYVDAIDGIHLYDNVRFEDNEVYNIGAYAINGYHAYNVIINHNNIHDIWQYGISMYGPDNDHSTNIIITNNTFTNCGEQAIKLRQTSNVLIQDNTMSIGTSPRGYDTPMGIGFSDDGSNSYVTINRNIMDAYGVGGTGIWSGIQSNANVVITNNRITNADYAGMIITFDYATITGNTITYRNICIKTDGTGITKSGNTCSPL